MNDDVTLLNDLDGMPLSIPRSKALTNNEIKAAYRGKNSFTDFLPWVEYIESSGCFLLEDGCSVGVIADVIPVATEGREFESLQGVRDQIESAFQDALPELDHHPWVIQMFAKDETDTRLEIEKIEDYVPVNLRDTAFTKEWLSQMHNHLNAISKPGGLFTDSIVTKTAWRGQTRKVRLVLYRWVGSKDKLDRRVAGKADEYVNQIYSRLAASLEAAGLQLERMNGRMFHRWMMPKFNPKPRFYEDNPQAFYDMCDYPADDELMDNRDLSEGLLFSSPSCDVEKGTWNFNKTPHRVIVVDEIRKKPQVGHITGETARTDGRTHNAVFDLMPEGTEMCLTMVAIPQDRLERHLSSLSEKAVGDSILAKEVRKDCETAKEFLADHHKLYQSALCFYINGSNDSELADRELTLTNQLLQAGLKPVESVDEIAAVNSYLRWLPMAFDPELDKHRWYTSFNYVQHIANLSPFFGRARGTGRPGFSFFNRGGESFHIDPLNLLDRAKNGHMVLLGPTGAGKSATLNSMFSQLMAVKKPRLFIIEVGNSFGLLGDYFKKNGLSVNKVKLAPGAGVTLAPFAQAHRLLDEKIAQERQRRDREDESLAEATVGADDQSDDKDEERDLLGEMEITARLMITGGDPHEEKEFRRADRRIVRDAIYLAGSLAADENRQCLTSDVRAAFHTLAENKTLTEDSRSRIYNMGESIGLFCDGFDGQIFNTPGEAWPEVDVTIIDLAHYARENYEAQLALSVISVTNMITNLAERDQYSGRPIVQAIDEAHIVTVNPLLSPFFVKVGKMGRKLSYWLWLATQNLEDFPNEAEKLLNMVEWWLCLVMPPDEVDQIARFKKLSKAQKDLLISASKESKKYTEGVVLSDRVEALFRVVPPSLFLALAGTEGEEKAERAKVMRDHGFTGWDAELNAAIEIARQMDVKRGMAK
jgi:conjugative transfer ATPase